MGISQCSMHAVYVLSGIADGIIVFSSLPLWVAEAFPTIMRASEFVLYNYILCSCWVRSGSLRCYGAGMVCVGPRSLRHCFICSICCRVHQGVLAAKKPDCDHGSHSPRALLSMQFVCKQPIDGSATITNHRVIFIVAIHC
eukprot:CFRG8690